MTAAARKTAPEKSAQQLLAEVRALGATVYLKGDHAALRGPIPPDLMERMRARRDEIIAILRAENEPKLDWWNQPVEGWREGRLVIRNIARDEITVINLRDAEPEGNA
jgi:hypothetical protein